VFPTDNAEVQQANLVDGSETGNLQKDPCTPDSRSCVPPQEDTIDCVGLGDRSPERRPIVEGNMSVGSVLGSAGCDAPLQGSITEPFSQQDREEHTATVDGEGTDDGSSSNHSSKVSSHEGPSAHAHLVLTESAVSYHQMHLNRGTCLSA
jgi:hypothetical protein